MSAKYLLDRDWAAPVRYPDPAVEVLDPLFAPLRLGGAAIERLWTGARWVEGPVWFGDHASLVFSDIPNDRLLRWSEETGAVTAFRRPSNNANGNTRDRQGRLITCEHRTRRVTRTEIDGTITVLLDGFEGARLNAPNDVVVHPDGSIWFTDPGYGIVWHYEGDKGEFELPTRIYRIDGATGAASVVDETLEKPNGLAFSPDYARLYVADTGWSHKSGHPHQIHVFDVIDGWRLTNGRPFHDFGSRQPGRLPRRHRRQPLGRGRLGRAGPRRRPHHRPRRRNDRRRPPAGRRPPTSVSAGAKRNRSLHHRLAVHSTRSTSTPRGWRTHVRRIRR